MAASRMPRAAPGLLLAVLTISGLAAAAPAHAQEQAPALFSAIPEGAQSPPSLDARAAYMTGSEMVVLNATALQAASVSATMLGDTYTISRDYVEARGGGDYTWFGSGDRVTDAILVVNGTEVFGLIYTLDGTFEILHVSSGVHEVYELDMSRFPPVGTGGGRADAVGGAAGASASAAASIYRDQISRLESAYVGWREYDEDDDTDAVTINVYVAWTNKAEEDYKGRVGSMAQLAVDTANRVYAQNDIPVSLSLADRHKVRGYDDAGSITADLRNLMDAGNRLFARVHAEIEEADADLVVMFVGDYHPDDDNKDRGNTCGEAHTLLAEDAGEAFAVVESVCIPAHAFTNVVGRLQGAGYNADNETNTEFGYGHGYYHAGADRRTVMSQSLKEHCDDSRTMEKEEVCERQGIWSDPHRNFFGTTTPAGTAGDWNARVIFSTAPHTASLRGGAQSYDSVAPTGAMTLPSPIPTSGSMQINATFSEPIHDWFPPYITITNGTASTAATMKKLSDTAYTYLHTLDGERGRTHLLLSNARDMLGNPVAKTPTSGASFVANAAPAPAPAPPPPGSVRSVHHDFQGNVTRDWRHSGDGAWRVLPPTESVPDHSAPSNRVVSSADCDDSCVLTLRDALDTTEPLTISLDRYVDAKIDGDEGLYVEYSADGGTTWTALASYTHRNGGDTDRWERSVMGLSIPQSSAEFRLRAESDRGDERVEVDNLRIFRPAAAEPDVSFTAVLNSARTSIAITLSKSTSHAFSASDFGLSSGAVSSIQNLQNSAARSLQVTGVPGGTAVTVTYTGPSLDLGGGAVLHNGTAAIAPPPPEPDRPPVIAGIPAADVAVGATATRQVAAADPDGDTIALSISGAPNFVTLADHGNGTGTVTASPTTPSHIGTHTVTVTATANSKAAQATFAITVTAAMVVDTVPTINPISGLAVTQGHTATRSVAAADPDGDPITLSVSGAPGFVTLADHGNGTGTVTASPTTPSHIGTHTVTVTATANSKAAQATFTVTVTAPDAAPTINPISGLAVTQGHTATRSVAAADADGDAIVLSVSSGPRFVSLRDNGDGTGTVTASPTAPSHVGTHTVTVTATANSRTAQATFTVTVTAPDAAPTIHPMPDLEVIQGHAATRPVTASDADGDAIALSISGNPDFVTLADNGDGTGTVTASPTTPSHVGTHTVTVTATANSRTAHATLTVTVTAPDAAPHVAAMPDMTITQGHTATRSVAATDPDGDAITLSVSGAPGFVTLADSGDGTGTITVSPNASSPIGAHTMNVTATANSKAAQATFTVKVGAPSPESYSRDPSGDLDGLAGGGTEAATGLWSDGSTMWVADYDGRAIRAYDASTGQRDPPQDFGALAAAHNLEPAGLWSDGRTMWVADYDDSLIYAYNMSTKQRDPARDIPTVPGHTELAGGLHSNGTVMWSGDADAGRIYAYDMSAGAHAPAADLALHPDNGSPSGMWSDGSTMWVSDWIDDKIYAYTLSTGARDPSGDFDSLNASGNNGPSGMWSDGITLWVGDTADQKLYAYRMPTSHLAPTVRVADQSVPEGAAVTLTPTVTNPNDETLTFRWDVLADIPLEGADTDTISFTAPQVDSDQRHVFRVYAEYHDGPVARHAHDIFVVQVDNVNRPPFAAHAGPDRAVRGGDAVTLTGTATDPDPPDVLAYAWGSNHTGLGDLGTGYRASFTAPHADSELAIAVTLTVSDGNGGAAADTAVVTVAPANRPPAGAAAGPDQTVREGTTVSLAGAAAADPDGDALHYSWSSDYAGLSPGTGSPVTFAAPQVDSDTPVTVTLNVTDGRGGSAADTVTITVTDSPSPAPATPTVTVNDRFANEGSVVTLTPDITNPGGLELGYRWDVLADIPLAGSDTGTVSFTAPEAGSDKRYVFRVIIEWQSESGPKTDHDVFVVQVNNINAPPAAHAGPDRTVREGATVYMNGTATDPDAGDALTYSWTSDHAGLAISNNGTLAPSFTAPQVGPGGAEITLTLSVSDGNGGAASDTSTVTVADALANIGPAVTAGPDLAVDEGAAVTVTGTATDPDAGDELAYLWQLAGAAILLNGSDTETASFAAPLVGSDTTYHLRFAANDGSGWVFDYLDVTIRNTNDPPTASAGPDRTVREGATVYMNGTATDPDAGDALTYSWASDHAGLAISGNNTLAPSFVAPHAGPGGAEITLTLSVSDGTNPPVTDRVTVTVTDSAGPGGGGAGGR